MVRVPYLNPADWVWSAWSLTWNPDLRSGNGVVSSGCLNPSDLVLSEASLAAFPEDGEEMVRSGQGT